MISASCLPKPYNHVELRILEMMGVVYNFQLSGNLWHTTLPLRWLFYPVEGEYGPKHYYISDGTRFVIRIVDDTLTILSPPIDYKPNHFIIKNMIMAKKAFTPTEKYVDLIEEYGLLVSRYKTTRTPEAQSKLDSVFEEILKQYGKVKASEFKLPKRVIVSRIL